MEKTKFEELLEKVKKNIFTAVRIYNKKEEIVGKGSFVEVDGDKFVYNDGKGKLKPYIRIGDIIGYVYKDFRCKAGILQLVCKEA